MNESLIRQQPQPVAGTQDIDVFRLGEVFAKSGYFADAKDATQAIVKILAGRELGIGPMASMNSIHIVQGKPTLSTNLIASSIKNAHSRYNYKVIELSEIACEIEFFEQGAPVGKSRFTMAEAKNAGLTNKDVWRKHPKNMLFARAISNGARWYCPDVFNGATVYTPEELNANVTEDGEMILHPRVQADFSKQIVEAEIVEATGKDKISMKMVPPVQLHTGTADMIGKNPNQPVNSPQSRTEELARQKTSNDAAPVSPETRGRLLFEAGGVSRSNRGYVVTEQIAGMKTDFAVTKENNVVKCTCDDYADGISETANYRCPHIHAVVFYSQATQPAKAA